MCDERVKKILLLFAKNQNERIIISAMFEKKKGGFGLGSPFGFLGA